MTRHKFEIGRIVRAEGGSAGGIPPGNYEVVGRLPSGDAERNLQYRVKAVSDGHQRIVKESDIR